MIILWFIKKAAFSIENKEKMQQMAAFVVSLFLYADALRSMLIVAQFVALSPPHTRIPRKLETTFFKVKLKK